MRMLVSFALFNGRLNGRNRCTIVSVFAFFPLSICDKALKVDDDDVILNHQPS